MLHCTKKLLDRLGSPTTGPLVETTTAMGSWYGTALFWRPQVALFVNETTLLPVLVHLAPARTVVPRLADYLAAVLDELGVPRPLVATEIEQMAELASTPCGPLRSRSGFPDKEVLALFTRGQSS
jgi:hypothetical protein